MGCSHLRNHSATPTLFWSGRLDSNQRPLASKARTLTRLSYSQIVNWNSNCDSNAPLIRRLLTGRCTITLYCCIIGRNSRIRTYDPLVPNQMRYQTALCSELFGRPPGFRSPLNCLKGSPPHQQRRGPYCLARYTGFEPVILPVTGGDLHQADPYREDLVGRCRIELLPEGAVLQTACWNHQLYLPIVWRTTQVTILAPSVNSRAQSPDLLVVLRIWWTAGESNPEFLRARQVCSR